MFTFQTVDKEKTEVFCARVVSAIDRDFLFTTLGFKNVRYFGNGTLKLEHT